MNQESAWKEAAERTHRGAGQDAGLTYRTHQAGARPDAEGDGAAVLLGRNAGGGVCWARRHACSFIGREQFCSVLQGRRPRCAGTGAWLHRLPKFAWAWRCWLEAISDFCKFISPVTSWAREDLYILMGCGVAYLVTAIALSHPRWRGAVSTYAAVAGNRKFGGGLHPFLRTVDLSCGASLHARARLFQDASAASSSIPITSRPSSA